MRDLEIRLERRTDHDAVDALHLAAFGAYGTRVVPLLHDLRAMRAAMSLVSERDGAVAGHVLFSPAWLDAPQRLVQVAVLSPVAVLPRHQRRGVGSKLIRHGLKCSRTKAFPPCSWRGHRSTTAPWASSLPWMTGTVVYSDVFWRHDAVGLRD